MDSPASPAPAAATTFEELPDAALVTILRHVPQPDRLASCARVSTAWAAAAAAAFTDVSLSANRASHKVGRFQAWLHEHAAHVTSVDGSAWGRDERVLRLPSAALVRLQRLQLGNIQPILSAPRSRQAPLFPALRSVTLVCCDGVTVASLALLQRAQLTELELHSVKVTGGDAAFGSQVTMQQQQQAVAALLQAQPRLSVLRLQHVVPALTDAVLEPLSAMQQLQELSITEFNGTVSPHGVMSRCSHLTSLRLAVHGCRLAASPPLQWPPGLVTLQLQGMQLAPAVLGGLRQLEELYLISCSLLPAEDLDAEADPSDLAAETVTLMSALAQLTRLRSLQLSRTALGALDEQQSHAFSALTASSHLASLILFCEGPQPLPRGALQHMLPPGRVLLALKVLQVERVRDSLLQGPDSFDAEAWCVDAADIDSISAACPSLESLKLRGVVRATPEVASSVERLQRLPLLELSVGDSTGWLTDNVRTLNRNAGLSAHAAPPRRDEDMWSEDDHDHSPAEQLRLITFYEPPDVWKQLRAVLQCSEVLMLRGLEADD